MNDMPEMVPDPSTIPTERRPRLIYGSDIRYRHECRENPLRLHGPNALVLNSSQWAQFMFSYKSLRRSGVPAAHARSLLWYPVWSTILGDPVQFFGGTSYSMHQSMLEELGEMSPMGRTPT